MTIKRIKIKDYKDLYADVVADGLNKNKSLYSEPWYGVFLDKENIAVFCIFKDKFFEKNALRLSDIEVRKEYRGQGIAEKIINWIKNKAKKDGYDSITLQTWKPSLKSFYSKFGFVNKVAVEDGEKVDYMSYCLNCKKKATLREEIKILSEDTLRVVLRKH